MRPIQIEELFTLQDRFNQRLHPAWKAQGIPYHRAIWLEAGELVEGTQSWKWWKKQGAFSLKQAQLEVVDILHFLLSWAMKETFEKKNANAEAMTREVLADLPDIHPSDRPVDVAKLIATAEEIACSAAGKWLIDTAEAFRALAGAAGLGFAELRSMYVGKNALNQFRNQNGYTDGTYQKVWNGEEDNVHLERIMAADPSVSFEQLLERLDAIYRRETTKEA